MKNIFITLLFITTFTCAFSQEAVLSKHNIRVFADAALHQYNRRQFFTAFCNDALSREGYEPFDRALIMENLNTNAKGREIIFKAIANRYRTFDNISVQFYSLGIDSNITGYLAGYVYEKYVDDKPSIILWEPKSKKFFEGTKIFMDSANYWKYVLTIKGTDITIECYPGKNNINYQEKTQRISIFQAYINGEKIVDIANTLIGYKYEIGFFYEKNDDGSWNKYVEISENIISDGLENAPQKQEIKKNGTKKKAIMPAINNY